MPTLRRLIGEILSLVLVCCLVTSLCVALVVVARDPYGSLGVAVVALVVAAALTRTLGEGLATFGLVGAVCADLALGLYALHVVFGVSVDTILRVGFALACLVLVLLASGSADNPYDD